MPLPCVFQFAKVEALALGGVQGLVQLVAGKLWRTRQDPKIFSVWIASTTAPVRVIQADDPIVGTEGPEERYFELRISCSAHCGGLSSRLVESVFGPATVDDFDVAIRPHVVLRRGIPMHFR